MDNAFGCPEAPVSQASALDSHIQPAGEDDWYEEFSTAGLLRQHERPQRKVVDWQKFAQNAGHDLAQPGSHGQRRQRSVWGNRFDAFRRDILSQEYVQTLPIGRHCLTVR